MPVSETDMTPFKKVDQINATNKAHFVFENGQNVVFAHWMLCCPVGYVEKGGGLNSHDRLNRLLDFLVMPS